MSPTGKGSSKVFMVYYSIFPGRLEGLVLENLTSRYAAFQLDYTIKCNQDLGIKKLV